MAASTSPISSSAVLLAVAAGTASAVFVLTSRLVNQKNTLSSSSTSNASSSSDHQIRTVAELRRVIPAGLSGSTVQNASKVLPHLDDQMTAFIGRSPMVMIATSDADGLPFVSPKGDRPGFVHITDDKTLVIPDRPGNRLVFGWQNLLANPRVGLLFQIPGNDTTLRVGGTARLSKDPTLCHQMAARGVDATLVVVVDVRYAFFHCSKAYIRSKLWQPESWPKEAFKVTFGRYFSSVKLVQDKVDQTVDSGYEKVRQSMQQPGSRSSG